MSSQPLKTSSPTRSRRSDERDIFEGNRVEGTLPLMGMFYANKMLTASERGFDRSLAEDPPHGKQERCTAKKWTHMMK